VSIRKEIMNLFRQNGSIVTSVDDLVRLIHANKAEVEEAVDVLTQEGYIEDLKIRGKTVAICSVKPNKWPKPE